MIFEKVSGGQLLDHIQRRKFFTEQEAAMIITDVASALEFLHSKGIGHRDLKPENVLCVYNDRLTPVKQCHFDLGSGIKFHPGGGSDTIPLLLLLLLLLLLQLLPLLLLLLLLLLQLHPQVPASRIQCSDNKTKKNSTASIASV